MTQSDDDLKVTILARRARFIAMALGASGLTAASLAACGGKTTPGAQDDNMPVDSSSPTNTGTPTEPTVCLSIAASSSPLATATPCLSMLPPTAYLPTSQPSVCLSPPMTATLPTLAPTTTPTPCLSIAPTPCLEPLPPEVPLDAGATDEFSVCLTYGAVEDAGQPERDAAVADASAPNDTDAAATEPAEPAGGIGAGGAGGIGAGGAGGRPDQGL